MSVAHLVTAKDNLCKVANMFRHLSTPGERETTARKMYEAYAAVAPKWNQLGETTKSVWYDVAAIRLAGHPFHLYYSDEDVASIKENL